MLIVDSQVHIWGAETAQRPWIPGRTAHWPEPLDQHHLLREMDRVGVDRTLLVPPTWEGARNDLVIAAAVAHPDRFGAIVRFDLDDERNADRFAGWAEDPHVLGIRAVFNRESVDWLTDGTAAWVWPLADQLGLPVFVFAPGQYAAIASAAERFPGLRFVVDHMGFDVAIHDGNISSFTSGLLTLAGLPNIAVKASSLPSFVSAVDSFPFPSLHEPIKRVVDTFGADRVFWGSDLSRLDCTYEQLRDMFLQHLPFLEEGQLELVMGKGICRWLGWSL
jgi:L-fuconolactonase